MVVTTPFHHRSTTSYDAIQGTEIEVESSSLFEGGDDDDRTSWYADERTSGASRLSCCFSSISGGLARGEADFQHIRPRRNSYHRSKCSILRALFVASVTMSLLAIGVLTFVGEDLSNATEDLSDWWEYNWEMGITGRLAQRTADRSPIHMIDPQSLYDDSDVEDHNDDDDDEDVNSMVPPFLGSSKHQVPKLVNHTHPTHPHPPEGCETTVMLVRHCEKGNLRSHCNFVGYERATYLASLFGDRWPLPSKVYALATKRKRHVNLREIETVQFVAEKAKVYIDEGYGTDHTSRLANDIVASIQRGDMCGKMILVSWKHSDIPKLARHLGCGPNQGCPQDYKGREFDQVWEIKYVFRTFLHTVSSHKSINRFGRKHSKPKTPRSNIRSNQRWNLFGSVQYENFDPLAYSKQAGDYPPNGTSHGGRWDVLPPPITKFYG